MGLAAIAEPAAKTLGQSRVGAFSDLLQPLTGPAFSLTLRTGSHDHRSNVFIHFHVMLIIGLLTIMELAYI